MKSKSATDVAQDPSWEDMLEISFPISIPFLRALKAVVAAAMRVNGSMSSLHK